MIPPYGAFRDSLIPRIYGINDIDFEAVALEVWQFQYLFNPVYQTYCQALGIRPAEIKSIQDIPFLPITLFRDHDVKTGTWEASLIFRSSGTTDAIPSKHFIRHPDWYHRIADQCFSAHFGPPEQYTWIGLLPSYLERQDSSLINMVRYFMDKGNRPGSSFFSKPDHEVIDRLKVLAEENTPVVLIGVSFALLDLFETQPVPVWEALNVIETGGMKGRRSEMTRQELHDRLRTHHPGLPIYSEYGMTELLSQAYCLHSRFSCGPTLRVLCRDISDPFTFLGPGQRGVLNVVDLANIDSCAFIATEDVGLLYGDGTFDVLGRLDQSDMRGCNLMYA